MDELDRVRLSAELKTGNVLCDFRHGLGSIKENYVATDYIILPIGNMAEQTTSDYLVYAVCEECAEAMYDKEWVLLVCLGCSDTRWVWRPYSRLDYRNKATGEVYDMVVLGGCPECSGEVKSLYFYNHKEIMG